MHAVVTYPYRSWINDLYITWLVFPRALMMRLHTICVMFCMTRLPISRSRGCKISHHTQVYTHVLIDSLLRIPAPIRRHLFSNFLENPYIFIFDDTSLRGYQENSSGSKAWSMDISRTLCLMAHLLLFKLNDSIAKMSGITCQLTESAGFDRDSTFWPGPIF